MARRDRDRRKVEQALELLQSFLQVTKTEYEMYFMGIVRKPPKDKHRELKRMFRELSEMGLQNTALRFKLKVVRARYNTLSLLWNRTCKQIEDGTYTKHRIMADKREARAEGNIVDKVAESRRMKDEIRALIRGEEVGAEDSTSTQRVAPVQEEAAPAPRPAARPKPARRGHTVGSNELVSEFTAVRKELGLDGRVNARALEARLRKHEEIVKARTGCREVRFRVVAEDGKPRLKAIPVK